HVLSARGAFLSWIAVAQRIRWRIPGPERHIPEHSAAQYALRHFGHERRDLGRMLPALDVPESFLRANSSQREQDTAGHRWPRAHLAGSAGGDGRDYGRGIALLDEVDPALCRQYNSAGYGNKSAGHKTFRSR